jgi:hypothetical protein
MTSFFDQTRLEATVVRCTLEEVKRQVVWRQIRTLLSNGFISEALKVASSSEHPDAVWLWNLFAGRDCERAKDAKRLFLECETNVARALSLAYVTNDLESLFSREDSTGLLKQAAELGDAFAQANLAKRTAGKERFAWAEKSAAQDEVEGFKVLARCFKDGEGCKQDGALERVCTHVAALMEDRESMELFGKSFFLHSDALRYLWLGRAAGCGLVETLYCEVVDHWRWMLSGQGFPKVVFAIGCLLKGNVNVETRQIFGRDVFLFAAEKTDFDYFDQVIEPAKDCISLFDIQTNCCKLAVDAWTVIALRNNVVKDIRKMIGMMVWNCRGDVLHIHEKEKEIVRWNRSWSERQANDAKLSDD